VTAPTFLAAAIRHLKKNDERFAALAKEHGRPTYTRTRNAFQSLARSIIYQQLNGNAAGTIYGRFQELFPGRSFPTPADVAKMSMPRLRGAGLSRAKANYVRELARHFERGAVNPRRFARMSDAEISASLTRIKGVGQWTVDMFLMFGLCRPDVLPGGDFAVRKAMRHFFDQGDKLRPAEYLALAEPWRPYRSLGSWYMWRVSDSMT